MKPLEFVKTYLPFAKQIEKESGIAAEAILTQAAIESAWGTVAPGNMFFGQKDTDGINGNEQLLVTYEYSRRADLKFPVILKVEPIVLNGQKMFKYTIKDYFRKYNTPADCFRDHVAFLKQNSRYAKALQQKNASAFLAEIAHAGYATDPNYNTTLQSVLKTIQTQVNNGTFS